MKSSLAADQEVRDRAIDTTRSFIVQAPAGSGKTELITRRLLALLAVVRSPEDILAVTFTRKAAAEMRERVLASLARAASGTFGEKDDEQKRELAKRALERSRTLGWRLEENPARLNISTIDGFNGFLAGRMPWLSRLGGAPGIAADAQILYGSAADRVIRHIEEDDEYSKALSAVLVHLDNRAPKLREYLISFLGKRDQWLRKRPVIGDPDDFRPVLEESLKELVLQGIRSAVKTLDPFLPDMAALARHGGASFSDPDRAYMLEGVPPVDGAAAAHWRKLSAFFLTKKLELRAKPDSSWGWPKDCDKDAKARVKALLERLRGDSAAVEAMAALAKLPDAAYSEEEWQIVAPVVRVADLALACLFLEFRERGEVDFAETALRGLEALGRTNDPSELMLALDSRISHILVDEFQDTSHMQFALLTALTQGWSEGDGRTLFVVGDPMQSIYRFREAEVGLFARAREKGLGGVRLESLRLEVNFRSQAPLITRFNEIFPLIFPGEDDQASGSVPYAPSKPHNEGDSNEPFIFNALSEKEPETEASQVADEVERALESDPAGSLAILVRARSHLREVIVELKRRGIEFRGEKLDPLSERLAVKDALSLARALADPADNLSWLAVLRAPWCGISLAEAYALLGRDSRPLCLAIPEALSDGRLGSEGEVRVGRFWGIVGPALDEVGRRPFRNLVEGVWALLGAPSYLDAQGVDDAMAAFELLDESCHGCLPDLSGLETSLKGLYSKPGEASGARLQIMTIHNAKGLEFDTVLLPGLGRPPRRDDRELISWEETSGGGIVIGAAPEVKAGANVRIADFLRDIDQVKEGNERVRLLYVAATRARKRLIAWGRASWSEKTGMWKPARGSLLQVLWPAVGTKFIDVEPPGQEVEAQVDFSPKPHHVERLGAEWLPPELLSPHLRTRGSVKTSSDEVSYDWAREERKLVGTVAHALFDRIGAEGLDAWPVQRVEKERPAFRAKLVEVGVAPDRLEEAVQGVVVAVRGLLEDEGGRALFDPSLDARNEYSLCRLVDGEVVTRRIDRTFVDKMGVRWVVDFKVTPHEGGDLERFLSEQTERYRGQLAEYAELFRALEPGRVIRAAIYYPLLQRLVEVEL